MDMGIAGKWALVCGASKGLGLGCAQALAAEGVHVVMVARRAEVLEASAAALRAASPGVQVIAVAADITTAEGRAAAFAAPGGPGTAFDIVVTNAGGPPPGDFRSWVRDAWIKAIDANMLTPIELIKATVDGMAQRGFGRIVNITSSAVKAPIDILGLSNGARSGLTGFVAGVARSGIAAQGVTINNLLPGKFDTDRIATTIRAAAEKTGQSEDSVRLAQQAQIPARRFGNPQEFGAICAFLCSVHASYMTGQNVLADGGAYAGSF
jgi:3-oxoacyl-[acyl-carrier protein] reductase